MDTFSIIDEDQDIMKMKDINITEKYNVKNSHENLY